MPIYATATRCFIEVARLGSIRAASEQLALTPSAVHRQIKWLEIELETPLFERHSRGMRLNNSGELLLSSLKRQQRDFNDVRAQFQALHDLRRGHVDIAALSYLSGTLLASFIATLRTEFTGITFTIFSCNSDDVISHIMDDTAEIGLGYPTRNVNQVTSHTYPTSVGVVMLTEHPLAKKAELKLDDCKDYPLILPRAGMEMRDYIERCGLRAWPEQPVVVKTDSFPALMGLVHAGIGIGFVTEFDVAVDPERDLLAFRKLVDLALPPPQLSLMVKSDRILPPATSMVMEQLDQEILAILDAHISSSP